MLRVPMLYQAANTPNCGPVCVQMVCAAHGRPVSLEDIVNALPVTKKGVYPAELAGYFLDNGFRVSLNVHLKEFPNSFDYVDDGQAQVLLAEWLSEYRRTVQYWLLKKNGRSTLAEFHSRGGTIVPKRATVDDLWGSLVRGVPPIMNVNAAVYRPLYGRTWREDRTERKEAGHYVVLTGMDAKTMTIHDPSTLNGGVMTMPTELVMHALYSWSGAVIFAEPS